MDEGFNFSITGSLSFWGTSHQSISATVQQNFQDLSYVDNVHKTIFVEPLTKLCNCVSERGGGGSHMITGRQLHKSEGFCVSNPKLATFCLFFAIELKKYYKVCPIFDVTKGTSPSIRLLTSLTLWPDGSSSFWDHLIFCCASFVLFWTCGSTSIAVVFKQDANRGLRIILSSGHLFNW